MRIELFVPPWSRRLMPMVFAVACIAVLSVAFPAAGAEAEGGSLVIPAWSFARGNVHVHADPAQYADAGPVVVSGPEKPWGWMVEYEIDIPVTGVYTIQACYAAAEARPVEAFFDGVTLGKYCTNVTFASASSGQLAEATWKSSGATWEVIGGQGNRLRNLQPLKAGKHTLRFTREGLLPHLVAIRLTTPTEFPEGWKPPEYKMRDMASIPAAHRKAFQTPGGVSEAVLRLPVADNTIPRAAGFLTIPACSFDRGNAKIYASPDEYADAGAFMGGASDQAKETLAKETLAKEIAAEYDIEFPVDGDYTLMLHYASGEARPTDIWLDGRHMGKGTTGVTVSSRPGEYPIITAWNSRVAKWEGVQDHKKGGLLKLAVTKGKHTLKIGRQGPLPHVKTLRLDSSEAFPEGWAQSKRKVDLGRVPPRYRNIFLLPGAVNTATLRLAIEDTMTSSGSQYPDGKKYLEQLSKLEAKQNAAQGGTAEDGQKVEDELQTLRSQAMMAHPELKFDKLLFLKRPVNGYGHTYADQHAKVMGGSLCVLSPVSPEGKITPLVPELEGGLFDRFDLSFDAKKVVFGYRKEDKPFRIHEIDIDPVAGKMVPGSLRQLTFGGDVECESMKCQIVGQKQGFHDMDPVYLPGGRIMFVSTRAERTVFCAPGNGVTTLYLMDADGKNLRRISESPVNETAPSLMNDGRVIYTRWEYVDKGLGNGESLWAIRPDGTGVDHVYKNNTLWPAGMSSARSIPNSQKIVTVGGGHHFTAVGPVILVDARRSRRTTEAMNSITPEIGYPTSMGYPKTGFGNFMDPYPFSEKFFLASHRPPVEKRKGRLPKGQKPVVPQYGLYTLDAWGNRALLHGDPELGCFEPMPLRPRRMPVDIAGLSAFDKPKTSAKPVAGQGAANKGTGTLFVRDIYRGMTGIARGRVKYIRVMGALQWSWFEPGISWNLGTDPHRKRIYGLAKVHEDGSCYFSVPAEENLLFQALDENYMMLQHMATFINVMPGEDRGCVGCHEQRRNAPAMVTAAPMALNHPPQTLFPQPGDTGIRMVDFAADVQPTLDKHCVGCHGGENPKGNLDLVGVPIGKFSRSYDNLCRNNLVSFRACAYGSANFLAVPPLTHGAIKSKLIEQLGKDSCKSKITPEEMIKIATWIDANVPYYGTYRGRRNPRDKDHPDFRLLPLVGY